MLDLRYYRQRRSDGNESRRRPACRQSLNVMHIQRNFSQCRGRENPKAQSGGSHVAFVLPENGETHDLYEAADLPCRQGVGRDRIEPGQELHARRFRLGDRSDCRSSLSS